MTTTAIPTQTAAVESARILGRAPRRQPNGRSAEDLQALDEALLRDLEEAADRASRERRTADWCNLVRARDAVADRIIARAARIARKAATR